MVNTVHAKNSRKHQDIRSSLGIIVDMPVSLPAKYSRADPGLFVLNL